MAQTEMMTSLVVKPNAVVVSDSGASDDIYDACSICLEPFQTGDPATVTTCNHEYHLQCILEWSQRSKECPICWRSLVLKDPLSQELLSAVEAERNVRARREAPPTVLHSFNDDSEDEQDDTFSDDSEFEERMLQNVFASANRDDYVTRREWLRSSEHGVPEYVLSGGSVVLPNNFVHGPWPSPNGSPTRNVPVNSYSQSFNSPVTLHPQDAADTIPRPSPPASLSDPCPSEMPSFSDTIKSRLSAASSRCKESIARSTLGLKDKLLVHNNSVKELSKGVHREMNASLSGVTRIFERLDLKRCRSSATEADSSMSTSNLFFKGKALDTDDSTSSNHKSDLSTETSHDAPPFISHKISDLLQLPSHRAVNDVAEQLS